MTHKELVAIAENWLRHNARIPYGRQGTIRAVACGVVLTETGAIEQPDAIGWAYGGHCSILIECKASRADFHADKHKKHRQAGVGMGKYRYYLVPKDLVKPEEVPDEWGLLYAVGRGVRVMKNSQPREINAYSMQRELNLLWSELNLLQRIQQGKPVFETPRVARLREQLTAAEEHSRPPEDQQS